jgi:hypothetical protein
MLWSEFEAVLDGFVPIPGFNDEDLKAVYIRIDSKFTVQASVFFNIEFDASGFADKRWNVPVQQLADTAAGGPDLGGGPIRLACHSQCNVAWHQENLWDPDMAPGKNHFQNLSKAVKNNRLGLIFKEPEPSESAPGPAAAAPDGAREKEFRDHIARLLKEQRLRISTLNSQHKLNIQTRQLEHQQRLQQYQLQRESLELRFADSEQRNQQLKQTIDGQASKIEGVREYFEHKLADAQLGESSQLEALEANFELELDAKVEAASTELKDQLQMRELELAYRREQENSLHEEITRLREENQKITANSGDQMLSRLNMAGVSFVAFIQGAGHVTIPVDDMARYVEDPQGFAAEKCGVGLAQYQQWNNHYQLPVCQALNKDGSVCSHSIQRSSSPQEFHPGESDRCDQHQANPLASVASVNF